MWDRSAQGPRDARQHHHHDDESDERGGADRSPPSPLPSGARQGRSRQQCPERHARLLGPHRGGSAPALGQGLDDRQVGRRVGQGLCGAGDEAGEHQLEGPAGNGNQRQRQR